MKLTLGRAVTLAILFASLLGLAAALWLIETYNIGTQYASEVPTATQTVKMCHNNECRYLAPDIAFRLNLGLGLFPPFGIVAGIIILALAQSHRSRIRTARH